MFLQPELAMKTKMTAVLVILLLGGVAMARDQFEGKWKVTVTPDEQAASAGAREFEETLVFDGGKFTAKAFVEYGFEPVEYEADTRGLVAASFTAEPKSKTHGTTKWSGFTTGQEIQGELLWTQADGTVMRYTFKGVKEE